VDRVIFGARQCVQHVIKRGFEPLQFVARNAAYRPAQHGGTDGANCGRSRLTVFSQSEHSGPGVLYPMAAAGQAPVN
jgi:hypothetical protein